MSDQIAWPAADRRQRIREMLGNLITLANAALADLDQEPDEGLLPFTNVLAWTIESQRNLLPASTQTVSTVQGLLDPDRWGKLPDHVVALTEAEIKELHGNHVYAAKQTRKPRKGDWAPDFKASNEYHTARAALFERLLPADQEEDDAPNPIYGKDGALVSMGGGPEVPA